MPERNDFPIKAMHWYRRRDQSAVNREAVRPKIVSDSHVTCGTGPGEWVYSHEKFRHIYEPDTEGDLFRAAEAAAKCLNELLSELHDTRYKRGEGGLACCYDNLEALKTALAASGSSLFSKGDGGDGATPTREDT